MTPDPFLSGAARCERKFAVTGLSPSRVEGLLRLHPCCFAQQFPDRWINSLYFDTPDFRCFADHVAGLHTRRKVRIRWYGGLGESQGPAQLELKLKQGVFSTKITCPLPGFVPEKFLGEGALGDLPEAVRTHLASLRPLLVSRYQRRYFSSRDGCLRATLDGEVHYWQASRSGLRRQVADRRGRILELKYAPDIEAQARQAAQVLPLRSINHSKYVRGVYCCRLL